MEYNRIGHTADIFKPGFPTHDIHFTHVGSLWWQAHLTDDQLKKLQDADIWSEEYTTNRGS